jgi:hypothetical protein
MADTEIIFYYRASPEGGYEARALGHAIFTQVETVDELQAKVREAVRCHFDDARADSTIRLECVRPRSLGSAKGEFIVPDDFNDPLPKEIEDLFWK